VLLRQFRHAAIPQGALRTGRTREAVSPPGVRRIAIPTARRLTSRTAQRSLSGIFDKLLGLEVLRRGLGLGWYIHVQGESLGGFQFPQHRPLERTVANRGCYPDRRAGRVRLPRRVFRADE
jgi:hypothetical protein